MDREMIARALFDEQGYPALRKFIHLMLGDEIELDRQLTTLIVSIMPTPLLEELIQPKAGVALYPDVHMLGRAIMVLEACLVEACEPDQARSIRVKGKVWKDIVRLAIAGTTDVLENTGDILLGLDVSIGTQRMSLALHVAETGLRFAPIIGWHDRVTPILACAPLGLYAEVPGTNATLLTEVVRLLSD